MNGAGIAGYALGCLAGYFSPGIPPVNAIVAAVIGYVVADRVMERRRTAAST